MLRKLVEALALISALAGPVSAASVELSSAGEKDDQTVYALALTGDIKSGDDHRVASLLGKALVEERFPGYIVLSSNGGNISASLGIARITHNYGIPVVVGAKCLSACAVIALSAWRGRLFVVGSGAIGLHQSWVGKNSAKTKVSLELTRNVATILRSYDVPKWVIEKMMRTQPQDMAYFSDAELRQIGALVTRP